MAKIQLAHTLAGKLRQTKHRAPPPRYSDVYPSGQLNTIAGVRLPNKPTSTLWDVSIEDGKIASIDAHDPSSREGASPGMLEGANRLLAPSLCHAHIHLDKCFLLQDPKFSDLQIEKGDFQEAMELTGSAKSRFEEDDLLRRGRQLIQESIHFGVTAMRAFVEVDSGVGNKCLEAGLRLKEEFEARCDVQICAFAQLPLFSGLDGGEEIRKLMTEASLRPEVEVVGSTPYVEQDENKMRMNIRWMSMLALSSGKHLDLHLDYFLDEDKQPLVWTVMDVLKERNWTERSKKQITLGHCTRLTRFKHADWQRLRHHSEALPISFVGLPTSDLFMMRTEENVRGTLPVVEMIEQHGFNAAIAVNNVGNAFTPYGTCDPLSIATLGVGLYQAGTPAAAAVGQSAAEPAISAALWDRHESTQQYSAVYDLSVKFLENVQHRFGEHSQQAGISLDTLGEFKAGKIPKNQAYATIVNQLGDDDDLKQQLHAVLQHEDARWHPDDFHGQVPSAPEPAVFPGFMQPEHHPQLRMPSVSSLWGPDFPEDTTQGNRSGGQGHVPYGFGSMRSARFNPMPSSPAPSMPNPFSGYDQYPTQSAMQTPTFSSYDRFVHGLSPTHGMGGFQARRSFSETENWNGNDLAYEHPLAADNSQAERSQHQYSSPGLIYREPPLRSVSPRHNFASQTPSVLGDPIAMPLGQPSLDMPPPTKQSFRKKAKTQGKANKTELGRGSPSDDSPAVLAGQRVPSGEKPFIHSICKKGFTTRNGVKKHHWGSKYEDPSTTTGCWYKSGKPDIAWDDHPSCKEPATKHRAPKPAKPQQNTLPGFPTLEDLPFKVAESLQATPPPMTPSSTAVPPLYYSPQLASPVARGNLDTLLTAVNVASKIEAPTPQFQGRNDSVISHLDAQVTAAESKQYSKATWPEFSHEHEHVLSSHAIHQPIVHIPYPSVGLGIASINDDNPAPKNLGSLQQQLNAATRPRTSMSAAVPMIATPSEVVQGEEGNVINPAASVGTGKRGRRTRSIISKRELQMLMDSSPGPDKKRLKV
ncbi:hypothetical protein BDV96DRAFT_491528 [Lophiotrema nucula]|uniref:Amidohydrolase-related domain-containing protein n=1 Tax=Lophiotrema nucula TaxID=690887 RepID=A0A6A5ZAI8_9PLEO|nr:hypothetical protein BDV96DRAFT_491528 [Lophiotrema nucula]